jgi:hypothetical protein
MDFIHDEALTVSCAFSSISDLFCINRHTGKIGMESAMENWYSPLENDDDAFFFLNTVIISRAEQRVTQVLRDRSPEFAKIMRRIRYLSQISGFVKHSFLGQNFLMKRSSGQISAPLIGHHEFSKLPSSLINIEDKNILDNIAGFLQKETEFFPAIPLNYLVKRCVAEVAVKMPMNFDHYPDETSYLYLQQIVEMSLEPVIAIINRYVADKKITPDEAMMLIDVMTDVGNDLIEFGEKGLIIDYVKKYLPNRSKWALKKKYGNQLKYLYNIFKKHIATNIAKEIK